MRSRRPAPECRSCVQRKAPLPLKERLRERPRSSADSVGMRRHHRDAPLARQAGLTCNSSSFFNHLRDLRHSVLWPNLRALSSRMRLMGLRDRFTDAMKEAMKARQAQRLGTIRLMLAAVQERSIAARVDALSE